MYIQLQNTFFNAFCIPTCLLDLDTVFENWGRQHGSNHVWFHHWSCKLVIKSKRSNQVLWLSLMQEKLRNQVIVRYIYLVTTALYFSGGTERGSKRTRRGYKRSQVVIPLPHFLKKKQPTATPRKKNILPWNHDIHKTNIWWSKTKARRDSIKLLKGTLYSLPVSIPVKRCIVSRKQRESKENFTGSARTVCKITFRKVTMSKCPVFQK